jgi:hypothetical protein
MMNEVKSEQELIEDVPLADSKVLAAQVVVYRTLGIHKELAKACMAELSARRKGGEEFEYEDFIDEKVGEMPKPQNTNFLSITKDLQAQMRNNVGGTVKTDNKKNTG